MPGEPRLDSWKEIAAFFGRDVRTVIRWERQRGLPVHRVPGGRRSLVFAYPHELRAWLVREQPETRFPAPPGRSERWIWAVAAAAMLLALLPAAWSRTGGGALPHRFVITGNELVAQDASGRALWAHTFGSVDVQPSFADWTRTADLDGDGAADVLASVETKSRMVTHHAGALHALASDGSPRWSVSVDDRLRFGGGEFGPPWSALALAVFESAGAPRIAWAVHHFTWWPGLLLTLDARGNRVGTFVNSGWIRSVTPTPDSRHLLIAGVSNSQNAYMLAVLDAANPTGRSPEPAGSETECLTCPPGAPLRYVVFPRTDVGREQPFPADGPSVQTFKDGGVQLQVLATSGPTTAATVYELSPDFEIRRARFNDAYWQWHRRLERDGRIDHSEASCPLRKGLEIRSWTPRDGWQTTAVPVS